MKGYLVSELNYLEVEEVLKLDPVIVLPIGGAAKEHGLHLPCGTDYYIVEKIAQEIRKNEQILQLPTLQYGYYPAFIEWAGSISIDSDTFIQLVENILKPFINRGVKKFLILDIGVSTQPPLKLVSSRLHEAYGVHVAVTDFGAIWNVVRKELLIQTPGGHGDEVETALMLAINPSLVRMNQAYEEYNRSAVSLTYKDAKIIHMSKKMKTEHGINGNPILATKEKGDQIIQRSVDIVLSFLREFKLQKL